MQSKVSTGSWACLEVEDRPGRVGRVRDSGDTLLLTELGYASGEREVAQEEWYRCVVVSGYDSVSAVWNPSRPGSR